MSFDVSNAPRCIFSMKETVGPNGTSKCQACELDQWKESGYVCGNEETVEGFHAQRKLSCVGRFGRNYYNPCVGTKGAIIVTKMVCSV